jgi:spore germination protein GerM
MGYHQLHHISFDRQLLGKSVGSGEKRLFVDKFRAQSLYESQLMQEKAKLVQQRKQKQLQLQRQVRKAKLEAREAKEYKENAYKRESVSRRKEQRAHESKKRVERQKARKQQVWCDAMRTRVSNTKLLSAWEAQVTRRQAQSQAASALAHTIHRPCDTAPQLSTAMMIPKPTVAWGS